MRCPTCGKVGALILHGPLRGYCGCADWGRVRGHRLLCSNRHRRAGCGHTFSMVLSWVLRGRQATAPQLWALLASLRRGEGLARAWRGAAPGLSRRTGCRLLRLLLDIQAAIRTLLHAVATPPACPCARPLSQVTDHLLGVFATAACPVAAFQERFGRGFLRS
jgi:hypothetical protein